MSDQYNDHQGGEFVEDVAADHTVPAAEPHRFAAGEKISPERVGEMAVKFASETAFAAAGVGCVLALAAALTLGACSGQRKACPLRPRSGENVRHCLRRVLAQAPVALDLFGQQRAACLDELRR